MRKILPGIATISLLFCVGISDSFASNPYIHNFGGSLRCIPTDYTQGNKSMVYSYTYDGTNDDYVVYDFVVFNDDFQEIKKFSTSQLPVMKYKRYYQERQYTYKDASQTYHQLGDEIVSIDGVQSGLSIEQVRQWVAERYGSVEIVTLINGDNVVGMRFFMDYEFGYKYPLEYFAKNADGLWQINYAEYQPGEYGPFGEWGEVREESGPMGEAITELEVLTSDGGDEGYVYLTQTLFDNGSSFNYCVPDFIDVQYSEEEEGRKEWGTRPVIVGFKIMDDNNRQVSSIALPSGYNAGEYGNMTVLNMNGKKYIIVEAEKEGDDENEYAIVYRMDASSSLSSQIAVQPTAKISPRAPMRGEKVNVTLGDAADVNGCKVNVVSTSGQTVMQTKVGAGETSVDIDTSRLQKGVYVVTVKNGNSSTEAAKIIVR